MAHRHAPTATLLALLLAGLGCPGREDPPGDDDDHSGDDDSGGDDDHAGDDDSGDDDDTTQSGPALAEAPLGVAFAFQEWAGQEFASHLDDLGLRRVHFTLWWEQFEPAPGDYRHELIDDFVAQLGPDDIGAIRITARGCSWGMTPESDYTVPADLTVGGEYHEFVREAVARADGRVALFENDWEVDVDTNWRGTPAEYAELTRTFHAAVRAEDPAASIVLGGSYADFSGEGEAFFDAVFADLESDGQPRPFDLFDLHLYQPAHTYPALIASMRAVLDAHPETAGVPIVALEFGGPTPQEFRGEYPELYDQLIGEFHDDISLLGSDLSSTPLQPDGYPDELRMFAFGLDGEPALAARRDRIQARGMARRSVVAMAEGVSTLYWWNLMAQRAELSVELGVYFRHFTYGKLNLTLPDPDPGGMTLTPQPTYESFQRVAAWLAGIDSVVRVDTGDPDIWLYRLTGDGEDTTLVVWHHRDPFGGEDDPPVTASVPVPWPEAVAVDVFGDPVEVQLADGAATLSITGTPVQLTLP